MSVNAWIVIAVSITAILYGIMIYNGLVALKHSVSKAWANIDVLLKQRHDELPKLIATCKEYMKFEGDTLEKVIQARSQVSSAREQQDIRGLGKAETTLRAGLGQLFALAENYPELKSNESFRQLQNRISTLESTIADRRELYNDSVNANNVRIEQFPDVIIAKKFGFIAAELLQFSDAEKTDIDVASLFKS
jgi:LemA protein